jgi:hypothetical protein
VYEDNAMKADRRSFVGRGLALAGLAGAVTATVTGLDSSARAAATSTGSSFASFGWEVTNLNDNGADVYFEVTSNMVVSAVDIDVAFMITALPVDPGFTEILCRAAVSPGRRPEFYKGDPGASFESPQSPNFGTTHIHNPNNLNVGDDGYLLQNVFYSVILKTFVPADGAASSTSRHISMARSLVLNAGDFLVFNMSHAGVPGDGEMQVVLQYTLT